MKCLCLALIECPVINPSAGLGVVIVLMILVAVSRSVSTVGKITAVNESRPA